MPERRGLPGPQHCKRSGETTKTVLRWIEGAVAE